MTFLSQYAVATDTDFIKRVTVAALAYAETVMTELNTVPGHTLRVQFALGMLRSPQVYGPLLALALVTNPAITLASTDGDLTAAVTADWDAMSGYST